MIIIIILQKADYGRVTKKVPSNFSPEKLTFTGNFTRSHKLFDINAQERRASMRKDIVEAVMKRTESMVMEQGDEPPDFTDDNPMYEDPRDVIGEKYIIIIISLFVSLSRTTGNYVPYF